MFERMVLTGDISNGIGDNSEATDAEDVLERKTDQ